MLVNSNQNKMGDRQRGTKRRWLVTREWQKERRNRKLAREKETRAAGGGMQIQWRKWKEKRGVDSPDKGRIFRELTVQITREITQADKRTFASLET